MCGDKKVPSSRVPSHVRPFASPLLRSISARVPFVDETQHGTVHRIPTCASSLDHQRLDDVVVTLRTIHWVHESMNMSLWIEADARSRTNARSAIQPSAVRYAHGLRRALELKQGRGTASDAEYTRVMSRPRSIVDQGLVACLASRVVAGLGVCNQALHLGDLLEDFLSIFGHSEISPQPAGCVYRCLSLEAIPCQRSRVGKREFPS